MLLSLVDVEVMGSGEKHNMFAISAENKWVSQTQFSIWSAHASLQRNYEIKRSLKTE